MQTWKCLCCALAMEMFTGAASAQSHHHHGGSPGGGGGMLGAAGVIPYGYWLPYYGTFNAYGAPVFNVPPFPLMATVGYPPLLGARGPLSNGVGVAGPWPPAGRPPANGVAVGDAAKAKRADPTRARQLVTFGDRLFRAGNLHRAAERYEQALNADANSAATRVRLAQVALVRGQFSEAADRYREALIVEPDWLVNAPDIQAIYTEPSDFAKQIAKLESHLQADPNDRDAWFVLGAQWFLSGQTRKAADVFLRLNDRKADPSLAAFLDATTPQRLPEQ
jgi:thioredoxin-like negative regulator of GroEL